jgi:iron complex transport system ATP-binding protein
MSINELMFGYDENQPVLKGIDATVTAGKIHVLLGPNATGKTTLLRLILGILTPSQGRITLGDHDNSTLDARQRARLLSYVPQQSASSFGFDVQHVVGMGRLALGPDPQQVQQAMAGADVLSLKHRPFNHLSAGQQQRVLLARAMAQVGPKTLAMLLDEPVSAMDLARSHQMMMQLRLLADQGLAIIVVLHDLNLAMHYADTVWLLHEGQLAAQGDWSKVMTPEVLGPVYRMAFERLDHPFQNRPILLSRPVVQ